MPAKQVRHGRQTHPPSKHTLESITQCLEPKAECDSPQEDEVTLGSPSMANPALPGLLSPSPFALPETLDYTSKASHHSLFLIWLLSPPEADYYGPAIKALTSSNQKPPLAHLINILIKIKHSS